MVRWEEEEEETKSKSYKYEEKITKKEEEKY